MKKIILAIALFAAVSANAQSDGFFTSSYTYDENRETPDAAWGTLPAIFGHDYEMDQNADPAPVGSGLLVLAGLGLGYAATKRRK